MSRIGKLPVRVPSGVTVSVEGSTVRVKGPKGELTQEIAPAFEIDVGEGSVTVRRPSDGGRDRAFQGLYRSLINNMVVGVSEGFSKVLEVEGVGYTARLQGSTLALNVGYNKPVELEAPDGITVTMPKANVIVISGHDKQRVGQFAAEVRGVRPPEPYKGKGIRYQTEQIRRKAGKAIGGKA